MATGKLDASLLSMPWSDRRKGRVGHHVLFQRLDVRNPGILAAPPAVGSQLVRHFGLERNAEPFDAARVAGVVEEDPEDANAREVPSSNHSGKQVELSVRTARGRGIEDSFDLVWVVRFGLDDEIERLHREGAHVSLPSAR